MVFSSIVFLCFFLPLTFAAYYALPRFRNDILLFASIVFYAWGEIRFLPVLLFSIFINYYVAVRLRKFRTDGVIVETTRETAPAALVLCDSFVGGANEKFLQESFSKTIFLHHQRMSFDPVMVEKFSPDLVIYVVVERLIPFTLDAL